jgi:LysR family transcriptional regulator, low CO2-responsive transcriptional regulator
VLDVQGLPIVRDWHVVHLESKQLSPIALAFKDFLLTQAAKLMDAEPGGVKPAAKRARRT